MHCTNHPMAQSKKSSPIGKQLHFPTCIKPRPYVSTASGDSGLMGLQVFSSARLTLLPIILQSWGSASGRLQENKPQP